MAQLGTQQYILYMHGIALYDRAYKMLNLCNLCADIVFIAFIERD